MDEQQLRLQELLDECIKADYPRRHELQRQLMDLGEPALDAVIERVRHSQVDVPRLIVTLGQFDDPRAIETLIQVLPELELDAARTAIFFLGKPRLRIAIQPLVDLLRARSEEVEFVIREHIGLALSRINDPAAVLLLLDLPDESELLGRWFYGHRVLVAMGETAVPALIESLSSAESMVVRHAIVVLGDIKDQRATIPILAFLQSTNSVLRLLAVRALGSLADQRAVDDLLALLQQDDLRQRCEVVDALGMIRDSRAIDPIAGLFDSAPNWLAGILAAADDEPRFTPARLYWNCLEALARLKELCVLEPLLQLLAHGNDTIHYKAIWPLGVLGDRQAVRPLIEKLSSPHHWVRSSTCGALAAIGDPRAVEALLDVLDDKDEMVRYHACEALGWLQDERAIPKLTWVAAHDEGWPDVGAKISDAAERAIGRIRGTYVEPPAKRGYLWTMM